MEVTGEVDTSNADRVEEKLAKILASQESRRAEIDKKKGERKTGADPSESAAVFFDDFKHRKEELTVRLQSSRTEPKENLKTMFDTLLDDTKSLQQFLSDSVRFLPPYDVQQAQKQIEALEVAISKTQNELLPKKKFAFKSRKQKKSDTVKVVDAAPKVAVIHGADLENKVQIADLTNATKMLNDNDINGKDVEITRLSHCKVDLVGQPNVLHIKDLHDCQVRIGPVSRSLLLTNCTKCRFSIACQQLRVHTTTDTDFYLHVTSRAIIEDCKTVRFAPYDWKYDGLEDDYVRSGLDKNTNSWNTIDDFKWLNPNQPSPNWSLIPENERGVPTSTPSSTST
eukprot:m.127072 g.127072  ORF g.127072 m.127072 type:complete len:340 (-) comp29244_c1_seq1:72-1091(-)